MIALVVDIWQRTTWDEFIVGGAAVLAAGTVIHRSAIRPMVAAFHKGARAWEWIEDELSPNGGDSLRDKIDTAGRRLDEIVTLVEPVPELARRLAALEQEVQNLKERQP